MDNAALTCFMDGAVVQVWRRRPRGSGGWTRSPGAACRWAAIRQRLLPGEIDSYAAVRCFVRNRAA